MDVPFNTHAAVGHWCVHPPPRYGLAAPWRRRSAMPVGEGPRPDLALFLRIAAAARLLPSFSRLPPPSPAAGSWQKPPTSPPRQTGRVSDPFHGKPTSDMAHGLRA